MQNLTDILPRSSLSQNTYARQLTSTIYHRITKRLIDVSVSGCAIVILLPLLLAIAGLIAMKNGPVLFRHKRVGRNGTTFWCLKFRTMVPDAEALLVQMLASDPAAKAEWSRDFKLRNDPRITPLGRFLRKTSLDELPQLLNVFLGDMSLVGPRPIVHSEVSRYGFAIMQYYSCRPGITGLWQVSGRNEMSYAGRLNLDVTYAKTVSAKTDFIIILRTFGAVLLRSGAY